MGEARKIREAVVDGLRMDIYLFRGCKVLISREFGKWHMSISRDDRYPDWDDIRDARYDILPADVTMAMLLPPMSEYVNLHPNCFHLHEIDGEGEIERRIITL